jgi:hypothetical protein
MAREESGEIQAGEDKKTDGEANKNPGGEGGGGEGRGGEGSEEAAPPRIVDLVASRFRLSPSVTPGVRAAPARPPCQSFAVAVALIGWLPCFRRGVWVF